MEEKTEPAKKALYSLLIMSGLIIITLVPVFNSYRTDVTNFTDAQKHDLETYRMIWLTGSLIVVVAGLLISYFMAKKNSDQWGPMRYPQLVLGMLALFVYVGVEVAVGSNLGELLRHEQYGGLQASEATPYIAMYWGSLMIGRWTYAVGAFNLKKSTTMILQILVPLAAFGILILLSRVAGYDVRALYYYVLCVVVQIAAFYWSKNKPARTLLIFSILGMIAMIIGVSTTGMVSIYAFLSGGLACSIMWPAIFSLSLAGLGKYTTEGAAFLVMMILGGGIIPPLQGKAADYLQAGSSIDGAGIHLSYWIPVLCFAYLAFFAFRVKQILVKQGIDYDAQVS